MYNLQERSDALIRMTQRHRGGTLNPFYRSVHKKVHTNQFYDLIPDQETFTHTPTQAPIIVQIQIMSDPAPNTDTNANHCPNPNHVIPPLSPDIDTRQSLPKSCQSRPLTPTQMSIIVQIQIISTPTLDTDTTVNHCSNPNHANPCP